ncbi:MAG: glycosyltransferase [Clostridia bacterium]|nr:glycosyltransferase [Clostridia bacterium]
MKIVQINATCGVGSTCKICVGISHSLNKQNIENYILYSSISNGYNLGISCSDDYYIKKQAIKSKIFGNYGFNSSKATKKMIEELNRINPDIVHLHNIHGHDCNLELLFSYLKEKKIKIFWTFHDCWAFTGYCPHFTMVKCNKWKSCCFDCVQRREFSFLFDKSKKLYNEKKRLFQGLDLTVITPSQWLADLVGESFLKDYPIKVINNGIDLSVFKPLKSSFREKYNISSSKKIILGVSFGWGVKKGLDIFIELSKRLDREKYQVVLVGTDSKVDNTLPKEILSIHRTQNQTELAEIYSAADVFINPTREENYPTVNMESIACGTPVITFKTGGSPEMLDETCGSVVECNDIDALEREVVRVCTEKPYSEAECVKKALEFDQNERFDEYIKLYERVITSRN